MTEPATLADVKKGSFVFWDGGRRDGQIQAIEVARVGRKWGYILNGWREARFDLRTGKLDGNPYGIIYLSRKAHAHAIEKERRTREWHRAWDDFKKGLNHIYSPPDAEAFATICAACDRAEAALRELGEWTDTSSTEARQ